jgi:hypothetical protein
MSNQPSQESSVNLVPKLESTSGVIHSLDSQKQASDSIPDTPKADKVVIFGPSGIEVGPSALHDTGFPYLAKTLGFTPQIIQRMENISSIKEVDEYIIGLAKERNMVDTNNSYESVLRELYKTLGISKLTDPYYALERLQSGIKLLKKQAALYKEQEAVARLLKENQ